ncbi:hypothetical protein ACWCRD_16285 [Streptomyces sp. NPDC002092]
MPGKARHLDPSDDPSGAALGQYGETVQLTPPRIGKIGRLPPSEPVSLAG